MTPPTKASPRPSRPKAPTTPPRPVQTAPEADASSLTPSGEGVYAPPGERPVTLAVVTGPHGVVGEVRLKLFTDDLSPYRRFNGGALTLKSLRTGGAAPIARFVEASDRRAAERLRGTELTVSRSELPELAEGEYYHTDLIDFACETDTGEPLGRVAAVENFGAGDIIEIERPDGRRFMVPITAAAIGDRVVVDAAFVD